MKLKKEHFFPFILTAVVIVVDQISKYLVVKYMSFGIISYSWLNELINLRLVYNLGAAFSIGAGFGTLTRKIILAVIPAILLASFLWVYFKSEEITKVQRWFMCGIIGGGVGNLLDRFFRLEGVVDFIDIKFFGIFGMERWPTFNVADSFIVVCGIGLAVTLIVESFKRKKNE